MIDFKEEHHGELRKFSSGTIQNEVITIISEHPYSADHFESNLQTRVIHLIKILKNEESLIESNEEHHYKSRNFSSGPIQNKVLTITSEYPSSEDHFESKF